MTRVPSASGTRAASPWPPSTPFLPQRSPEVACVVAGFRSGDEVAAAARWSEAALPDEAWADLDGLAERACGVRLW
ncbi:hypothetical protein AB0D38_08705 [Streptomyces sp. NPDC048279]|uniref:hypothetical protein n=1 Tax=Streptomyces sp. NPDC048279 TaxID=3154714 RepID=UPI003430274D